MNRKEFLRKGLLGTAVFTATGGVAHALTNKIDELKELEVVGFNHIPNAETESTPDSVLHRAATRGNANHGWLNSHHTFSFANYYNPDRMHFGVLRVLNDDTVQGGMGFGTHPHDNMEIISIPLEGDLEHKDSMGNVAVIKNGDVQVMSAGTGITHSEYNRNKNRDVKFLQIWLFPKASGVKPRYDQITLNRADRKNNLQQILSPNPNDAGVWIHQDAWFHLGTFDKGFSTPYAIRKQGNGAYVFVIKGSVSVNGQELQQRDGYGVWNTASLDITSLSAGAEILIMDVPMMA
ncbi:MAG: pirin family protein [Candidatus Kapabacteria bacterium]|nr:pirin family protein [Candidatus Kapabacteria bacterium]